MGNIFNLGVSRTVLIASQNIFSTPIKHPSRTLCEHVISYVVKGEWSLNIENEVFTAPNDGVFFQPAHIPHIGTHNCPPDTHTLFVHFSVAEGDAYAPTPPSQNNENSAYINSFIDCKNSPQIKKLFLKIIEETTKGNRTKASAYLNVLLCELSEVSLYDTSKHALGANIKKIIASSSEKNVSNKKIAQMLNVSVRNAETAFKECFGTTIHRYQLAQKIEHAKFCLAYYPKMKIIDISLSLGFFDEFHFSRQFKKAVGLSPKEYRQMNLAKK